MEAPPGELDLWQRAEDRSLINLVTPIVQTRFVEATQKKPDLFGKDEYTLYKLLKNDGVPPTPTDNRLRLSFWLEYDRAQAACEKMNLSHVYNGVCMRSYFYESYLSKPEKIAWLTCPPASYEVTLKESVTFGLEVMRSILGEDPESYPPGQRIKFKELQAKIFSLLDMREKGAFTQRSEIKQMNLNVSSTDGSVASAMLDNSMEAIEKKIKELERRERKALNMPDLPKKEAPTDGEIVG